MSKINTTDGRKVGIEVHDLEMIDVIGYQEVTPGKAFYIDDGNNLNDSTDTSLDPKVTKVYCTSVGEVPTRASTEKFVTNIFDHAADRKSVV